MVVDGTIWGWRREGRGRVWKSKKRRLQTGTRFEKTIACKLSISELWNIYVSYVILQVHE